jgi:protein-S-isoprenylcysteine O-methyltransferase Ste14
MEIRSRLCGLAFRHRSALLALLAALPAIRLLEAGEVDVGLTMFGLVLMIAGAAVRLVSIRSIGKSARVNRARASTLQTSGMYAHVRNPLYLANGAIGMGLTALAGSWDGVAVVLLGCVVVYGLAVRHEEAVLGELFGSDYARYAAQVPRWLPRLRPAGASPSDPVPWAETLSREWRLVVGLPLGTAALLLVRSTVLGVWLTRTVEGLASLLHLPPAGLLIGVTLVVASLNALATEHKVRRKAAKRAAMGNDSNEPTNRSDDEAAPTSPP